MVKRVFIIHGWSGFPDEGWFPWLKKELVKKGFKAEIPAMPNPDFPKINEWVSFLAKAVKKADENTFFVGHSIGCQTILRYLESLPQGAKVGGVVLVAGWLHLTEETFKEEGAEEIASPWLDTPIDWDKILLHADKFTAIFSANDLYVPLSDSKIFMKKLDAKLIVEHGKGHFSGSDNVNELPSVLAELLRIAE